jgi:hypothetical protein
MSFISLGSKTIHLPVPGIIEVEGAAQQSAQSGSGQSTRWSFNLYIDGLLVWNPGGSVPLDCVYLGGCKYCEAGDRTIELRWIADPSITVTRAFLKIKGLNNTQGV